MSARRKRLSKTVFFKATHSLKSYEIIKMNPAFVKAILKNCKLC